MREAAITRAVVDLPWPARALHPNARVHWAKKAEETRKARFDAGMLVCAANVKPAESLALTVTFHPPSNRGDTDNMLAACKAYFDGISDAIGVDDRHFEITPVRGEPVKGGLVRVEIAPSAQPGEHGSGG